MLRHRLGGYGTMKSHKVSVSSGGSVGNDGGRYFNEAIPWITQQKVSSVTCENTTV